MQRHRERNFINDFNLTCIINLILEQQLATDQMTELKQLFFVKITVDDGRESEVELG